MYISSLVNVFSEFVKMEAYKLYFANFIRKGISIMVSFAKLVY